jgi:signal peptidase I
MQQEPTIPQAAGPGLPPEPDYTNASQSKKTKEGWKSAFSTIAILIAAPLVAIFLTSFVFQSYEVDGPSMETTLQNRDRLIVWKLPPTIAHVTKKDYIPSRGEIIVFTKHGLSDFGEHNDKQLIKRVVGLPGERVVVDDSKITVYNKEHPEGFDPDSQGGYTVPDQPTSGNVDITVPTGEVFVVGDNRANSLDSRAFGTISSDDIVGELAFRIFPFNKAKGF